MSALRSDRVWLFGGLGLVALLIAASWFLLIQPKYNEASDMRGQAEETTAQLATLRKKLADLKVENTKLSSYHAKRDMYLKALPTGDKIPADDIPAFLTQLQIMGMNLGVDVDAYSASGRDKSQAVSTVEELPIALNATGSVKNISTFLNQLQNTQPRAVLVQGASLKFQKGKVELSLTLKAFRNPETASTAVTTN
ncbi:type 4a pilus biogenesis protein PilO [Actinoplanes siamensis]|uniref:Type IV pilus assembly protein PilO n=1 Tax=Actinoplanes siamensis TaxID=1223317 RepID=A0A919N9N8_9ACTN|nr:type 4a pilus biogenesis protein PilO [Actinoplanes siamensis]GIF06794.1 hypothetical protein Asi03nite_43320 [Actinoplanes siamensis]